MLFDRRGSGYRPGALARRLAQAFPSTTGAAPSTMPWACASPTAAFPGGARRRCAPATRRCANWPTACIRTCRSRPGRGASTPWPCATRPPPGAPTGSTTPCRRASGANPTNTCGGPSPRAPPCPSPSVSCATSCGAEGEARGIWLRCLHEKKFFLGESSKMAEIIQGIREHIPELFAQGFHSHAKMSKIPSR